MRTDRAQYSKARGEQKEHCSNATMSSLAFGASEEAADALHNAQYQPESPRQLLYGAGPVSDIKIRFCRAIKSFSFVQGSI